MISEVWQRLGLDPANPMSASATAITAGSISQSISEGPDQITVQRA